MTSPTKSLPFLTWPSVPSIGNHGLKSLLLQLDEIQWWSADELSAHQFTQLQLLVDYAQRAVQFYRERFAAAGLPPGMRLSPESWRQFPLLTRHDVPLAGSQLHSPEMPESHGRAVPKFTGGSTAKPVMTLSTAVTDLYWRTLTIRDHLWQQRNFAQNLGVIRYTTGGAAAPPDGEHMANWGQATAGLVATGPCEVLSVASTIDQQAHWLLKRDPAYLLTYPSLVFALATHFQTSNLRLPNLREVRTFGEVLEPKVRDACRDAFNVNVVNNYSSQEVGYIALQCPKHEHFHVQSESLIVEVLDDTGGPCQPGQIGKVVITTLHNFAMPLLRYDIGDYAEVGERCPCGRGLPVLRRILGRKRNMFILPSGEQRWPAFELDPTAAFTRSLPVSQFQVIQRSLREIEVMLVSYRPLTFEEEFGLRSHVSEWLGYPFDVTFTYVDSIPRSPSGKFEDFRCDVAPRVDNS